MPPTLSIECLLADDRWMRRLARRLVADPNQADDLVQDAWLVRLTASHAVSASWMRAILRNAWRDLLRGRARRERREEIASRLEATTPTDEIAAELEVRRRVAEAVVALEEPFRSLLFLRFYRDLSLEAIAREQGISVSTVHQRLQGGLARVRARLDDEHGGVRRMWAIGLVPLARSSGACVQGSAGMTGGSGMATGINVAASLLAALTMVTWLWLAPGGRIGLRTRTAAAPSASAERVFPWSDVAPVGSAGTGRRPADVGGRGALLGSAEPSSITGWVVDRRGNPISQAWVGIEDWTGPGAMPSAFSGEDGVFTVELPADGDREQRVVCLDQGQSTLIAGTARGKWVVVVSPRRSFAGVVEDEHGAPVAGAELLVHLDERIFHGLGIQGSFHKENWRTVTDRAGRFLLRDVAGGPNVKVEVRAKGFLARQDELPQDGDLDPRIVLQRDTRPVVLSGVVLDSTGRAVEGAWVSAGLVIERTHPDGSFEITSEGGRERFEQDLAEAWAKEGIEKAKLVALEEGLLPCSAPLMELDFGAPVVLRLGAVPMTIRGRVVDVGHRGLSGIVVSYRDRRTLGPEVFLEPGDGRYETNYKSTPRTIDVELSGGYDSHETVSAADGSFELGYLTAQDYELVAFDPRTAELGGPWTVQAGDSGVELVLEPESDTVRVAGRVLTLGGDPIEDVEIIAWRVVDNPHEDASQERECLRDGRTDAVGRFEFERLATRDTWLVLEHPRLYWPQVSLAEFSDLENIEISVPILCEVQVDLTRYPSLTSASQSGGAMESGMSRFFTGARSTNVASSSSNVTAEFLDADDAHLDALLSPRNDEENALLAPERIRAQQRFAEELGQSPGSEPPGPSWSVDETIRSGVSLIVWVKETARTLLVRRDGVEVARFPVRLDPEQRTTVKP